MIGPSVLPTLLSNIGKLALQHPEIVEFLGELVEAVAKTKSKKKAWEILQRKVLSEVGMKIAEFGADGILKTTKAVKKYRKT